MGLHTWPPCLAMDEARPQASQWSSVAIRISRESMLMSGRSAKRAHKGGGECVVWVGGGVSTDGYIYVQEPVRRGSFRVQSASDRPLPGGDQLSSSSAARRLPRGRRKGVRKDAFPPAAPRARPRRALSRRSVARPRRSSWL